MYVCVRVCVCHFTKINKNLKEAFYRLPVKAINFKLKLLSGVYISVIYHSDAIGILSIGQRAKYLQVN